MKLPSFLSDRATLPIWALLCVAAVMAVLVIICLVAGGRNAQMKYRLRIAASAAEEAARAAALAAGGIDPEIVIQLLRSGHPVSLQSVAKLIEQKQAVEAATTESGETGGGGTPTAAPAAEPAANPWH